MQKTYEKYRAQGLTVLGIDAQDFRGDAKRFAKRFGVTYPVVYDGSGSTLGKWGVTGFPETFFVDRSGRLVGERIQGGIDTERNKAAFAKGIAGRTRHGAVIRLAAALLAALALVCSAAALAGPPRQADLEAEIVCPTCKTTLDQSNSPIATRMKAFIRTSIAAGDRRPRRSRRSSSTSSARPCSPSRRSGGSTCSPGCSRSARSRSERSSSRALAWTWSRRRDDDGDETEAALDPDLERRVDEELARFED